MHSCCCSSSACILPRAVARGRRAQRVSVARCVCVLVCVCSFGVLAQDRPAASVAPSAPQPSAPPTDAEPPALIPPSILSQTEAVYPADALAERKQASLVLLITVGTDGTTSDPTIVQSGGASFDQAALDAVRSWTFKPATRGGVPVATRIRVPFLFAAPSAGLAAAPPVTPPGLAPPPAAAPLPTPPNTANTAAPAERVVHVTVHGKRILAPRAVSDFVIAHDVITVAPHSDAGSLLSTAPGVYVSRPEGEAVAQEIFLRGFDAEHGQDIAFSAAGIPINQPSQLHGQGYADLGFIPPEVIRSVRVTEGVYDPRQGDFAVAGSMDFDLGVVDRGITSRTAIGSFGTLRQLLLWAPPGQDEETFGVAAVRRSSGFGENRGSMTGNGMAQLVLGTPNDRTVLHVSAYGARANLAGVLRYDDVRAGRVGFYDAYDDPTANAQSAFASHLQLGVQHENKTNDGAVTRLGMWLLTTNFRLRENFTGYLERSQQMPEWVGRGDLIEQGNTDMALGAAASHRTRRYAPASWAYGTLETGLTFRADDIDQTQNLLEPPQNETWDRRVDATIHGADIGAYADIDWHFTRYVAVRGGARADVLYYDVDDRLGNFIPRFRRETYIVGFRRTALGLALGPRGTLELRPLAWLSVLASYGRGYRSPQARQLEEGENAPYATVDSAEVGARAKLGEHDAFEVTVAAFRTHLSVDLAFDPSQGRLERIGPSTRRGLATQILARPWRWALASLSATWVQATLDAPPPPTPENPDPPFTRGELLPYVPPVVLRADLGAHATLWRWWGADVRGRAGLGATWIAPRPLPYSQFSDPIGLLDVSASLGWRALTLGVEITNAFDSQYAASEYSFVSDWGASKTPSLLPARHFAAGPPRTLMFTLEAHL
jgi:iron complex outermembrane receptor protein